MRGPGPRQCPAERLHLVRWPAGQIRTSGCRGSETCWRPTGQETQRLRGQLPMRVPWRHGRREHGGSPGCRLSNQQVSVGELVVELTTDIVGLACKQPLQPAGCRGGVPRMCLQGVCSRWCRMHGMSRVMRRRMGHAVQQAQRLCHHRRHGQQQPQSAGQGQARTVSRTRKHRVRVRGDPASGRFQSPQDLSTVQGRPYSKLRLAVRASNQLRGRAGSK